MGLLSRVKGRLKGEIKRRMESDSSASTDPHAPLPPTAGPAILPDPDIRPEGRNDEPWYLDGEQDGWDETNPDD
jgi:hypothetical protein